MFIKFAVSSINYERTRTFFHMMDRYFGNNSLEPFESKFISSTGLAMAYLWLSWSSSMRGYETIFSPYGGTHSKAPKRKNVALLAL